MLVSTLTTDTWSSDKFRRTVDTSWICIAAWMISILKTLSCVMVASCIIAVALDMCALACKFTDENYHLKDVYDPFKDIVVCTLKSAVVVIHFEFFCLVISHLCIKFSSI